MAETRRRFDREFRLVVEDHHMPGDLFCPRLDRTTVIGGSSSNGKSQHTDNESRRSRP